VIYKLHCTHVGCPVNWNRRTSSTFTKNGQEPFSTGIDGVASRRTWVFLRPVRRAPWENTQRANRKNPGLSPTTVMWPLQGEMSSTRNTSPGRNRLVSPSVAVIEKSPSRTTMN